MKKLFVSDVDHTLVGEDRKFSNEIVDAIKKVYMHKDIFVLCSGRATPSLLNSAIELHNRGVDIKYISGYNGAQIMDVQERKIIVDEGFNYEQTIEITKVCDELNLDYALYDDEAFYVTDLENEYAKIEQDIISFPMKKIDKVIRSPKVLIFVDPEKNKHYRDIFEQRLPNFTFEYSQPFFIEVTKRGISKATALTKLVDIEQIEQVNTYGFGDGGNDRELIKAAHTGVVVANAKEEIKKYADVITESVYDNGVANFINKLYDEKSE